MLRISHSILHAFDFQSGSSYLSQHELDLEERQVRSYVARRMRNISSSPESKHGEFSEQSAFADAVRQYAVGQLGFVEISQQVGEYLWEELRRCDDLEECDLLMADFTDTREMKVDSKEVQEDPDAAAAAAFDGSSADRYLAAVLLPRKQAFVHDLGSDAGGAPENEILRQDSTLPNPTQKVDSYVLVNLGTMEIDFLDKPRMVGTEERLVIPDGLLQCTAQASSREVVESVERIVEDVAEQYGVNPVEAVAQAKAYVASNADRDESFSPEDVGQTVFEDRPDLQERYQEATREESLPEEVPIRRGVANRMARNHKIKTDTGIEITFPSEYAADSNYIEFTADDQGNVSIIIKNVGKIENK